MDFCRIFLPSDSCFSTVIVQPECLWLFDLKTCHEPVELLPGQLSYFEPVPWPAEPALGFHPLVEHDETVILPEDSLYPVAASATEKEQCALAGIHFQLVTDDRTQAIDRFSHIGVAADDIDLVYAADIA